MGVSSSSQALDMPSMVCENCHMMCGFSGLPKFRQLVAATGVAPVQATLRAASATACIAPSLGSSQHQRPLPARAIAKPRCGLTLSVVRYTLFVEDAFSRASSGERTSDNVELLLMRMTPASPPGP